MERAEFDRLKDQIESEYARKIDALKILFPEFDSVPTKGTAKSPSYKAKVKYGAGNQPSDKNATLCDVPGCGKKLRSDSKTCGSCTKRVCSKHFNRAEDKCWECSQVPA